MQKKSSAQTGQYEMFLYVCAEDFFVLTCRRCRNPPYVSFTPPVYKTERLCIPLPPAESEVLRSSAHFLKVPVLPH